MRDIFMAAAAAFTVASGAVPAAAQSDTGPRYDTRGFDVVGISLGMSPEEAAAQMRQRGFTVADRPPTFDYAQLVKREADRLRRPVPAVAAPTGPEALLGSDPAGNRLEVEFVASAAGVRAARVTLTLDTSTNVIASFKDDLIRRYGQPTRSLLGTYGVHWCSAEESDCGPAAETAKLEYVPSLSHVLRLTDRRAMVAQRDQEIAALFAVPSTDRQRQLLFGAN